MYNQRKRNIIILIVVAIILILVLIIGGFFMYLKTDLFKSNKNLFLKYAIQTIDNLKIEENKQLNDFIELKKIGSFKSGAKLTFGEDEGKNIIVNINTNKNENQEYKKFDLAIASQNIFNVEYVKNDNIYALKSNEIVNGFLGIKGENLKVLAQKCGLKNTELIPDSVDGTDFNLLELIKISDEEKEHIKNTYTEIFAKTINDKNFSKEKNFAVARDGKTYNTTAYRLTLSKEDTKQIQINFLETLKEDSITLNLIATKASEIGLDESYTNVNNLSKKIEYIIQNINKNDNYSAPITAMIYVYKGSVITTEIIYNNKQKYTIYGIASENNNIRYLLIENLSASENELSKIEIKQEETRNSGLSDYHFYVNLDNEKKYDINMKLTGMKDIKIFNLDGTIKIETKDGIIEGSYNEEFNFENKTSENILKLDRSNCGVLNDFTTEQVEYFVPAIRKRTEAVLNQKKEMIKRYLPEIINKESITDKSNQEGSVINSIQNVIESTSSSVSEQEVMAFNAKFEPYKGNIGGTLLKSLKSIVDNNNTQDMENQVTLYIDSQRSFGDNVNIDSSAKYNVTMEKDEDTGFIVQINANKI